MRKKRFPLPKPGAVKFTYCKLPVEGNPKTSRIERKFYDCGYCAGCDERHIGVKTASVAGFPFLCENCYRMVFQYSQHIEDPYGIKRMWEDEEVSVEKTRKIIACAKRLEFTNQTMLNALMYKVLLNDEDTYEPDPENDQRQAAGSRSVEDEKTDLQKMSEIIGNGWKSRNTDLTTTCGWSEKKELMHYKKVLPPVDERDFEFDICDLMAFSDYLKRITITVDVAYQNDRIRSLKDFISKNPLVDVTCEAIKTKDGLTQIRLVHRAETIDDAHEKFRRIILKYRSVFPYLSDASGMVYDDQKTVIVVLRQYKVQGGSI